MIVLNYFNTNNISHYTYQLKSERAYRVVLRGLHASQNTTEISKELYEIGHEVRQIVNIRHRATKEPLPIFYVDLEPKPNNKAIFDVKYLNNMKVTFEAPYKKRKSFSAKDVRDLVIPRTNALGPIAVLNVVAPTLQQHVQKNQTLRLLARTVTKNTPLATKNAKCTNTIEREFLN